MNQPLDAVYECWSTQEKMETWFLEKAIFRSVEGQREPAEPVRTGDRFTWKWNNWDFNEEGDMLQAKGQDIISFTCGSGGTVKVELSEVNGRTEVRLTQSDIPTDENSRMEIYVGCITGWTFWLANLKAFLEHNITLHAKGLSQDETADLVNS